MSRLAEYRQLEQSLAAQMAQLEQMKGNTELKREVEFEKKLWSLLDKYQVGLKDIINILDPQASRRPRPVQTPQRTTRRARNVKTYKNPHNGEVVETKGGNHKLLQQWKSEYGRDEVESWLA